MAAAPEQIDSNRHFGGFNKRYRHRSEACGCDMTFTIFFPPQAEHGKVPVLYYLSGLTCTDENFISKAGAQRKAAGHGIALVAPDTSPRGHNVPGESDSWDFGVGAGFYLNATQDKWKHWRMYDYVTAELPSLLQQHFANLDTANASIMGHSMGGHGALILAAKNPGKYKSVSAFSPICHPSVVPWGQKAFHGYLGEDKQAWAQYDATELYKDYSGPQIPLLVDTGSADKFLKDQLQPHHLQAVLTERRYPCTFRLQEGYDHSYYFISTFVGDHIDMHAQALELQA